jgi:hypothetical protein
MRYTSLRIVFCDFAFHLTVAAIWPYLGDNFYTSPLQLYFEAPRTGSALQSALRALGAKYVLIVR